MESIYQQQSGLLWPRVHDSLWLGDDSVQKHVAGIEVCEQNKRRDLGRSFIEQ